MTIISDSIRIETVAPIHFIARELCLGDMNIKDGLSHTRMANIRELNGIYATFFCCCFFTANDKKVIWLYYGKVSNRMMGRGSVDTQLRHYRLAENDAKGPGYSIRRWKAIPTEKRRPAPIVVRLMGMERFQTGRRKG